MKMLFQLYLCSVLIFVFSTCGSNSRLFAQMSDSEFFNRVDLDYPGLSAVKSAVNSGNYNQAKSAYATYLRQRTTPNYWVSKELSPNYPSSQRKNSGSTSENALINKYTVEGCTYQFPGEIQWQLNPSNSAENPSNTCSYKSEWVFQFNRHHQWVYVGQAFQTTGNPIYAEKIEELITHWVPNNPVPNAPPVYSQGDVFWHSPWRTLDAGIRVAISWPDTWRYVVKHPNFDDNNLITWVKSWMQHGDFLTEHYGSLNWLTTESQGLYNVGSFFPEFKDAANYRNAAVSRLQGQLDTDIYPDGAQKELAPHYHRLAAENFANVYRLAKLNNYPINDKYGETLESMFAYLMDIMTPERMAPRLNDSYPEDVKDLMSRLGASMFDHRSDFLWIATNGTQGTAPTYTAKLLPWAGQAVLRDSWDQSSDYLLFEYGPYGASHQHEDKLGLHIAGNGDLFVFETGRYTYSWPFSTFREYCLSSQAHSVLTIDGRGQNREKNKASLGVSTNPDPVVFSDNPEVSYSAASYGVNPQEGYGSGNTLLDLGEWKRHVVNLKPGIFVVMDVVVPNDNSSHTYHSHFHLNADNATYNGQQQVTIQESGRPSFTITPVEEQGLSVEIIKGQTSPEVLGWELYASGTARKIPTVRYKQTASGTVKFGYAFQSAPIGSAVPQPTIEALNTVQNVYGVSVSWLDHGTAHEAKVLISTTPGGEIEWEGETFPTSGIMIKDGLNCPIDLETGLEVVSCSGSGGGGGGGNTDPCEAPDEWEGEDIGNVAYAGQVCFENEVFTIDGSGDDIWNAQDAFHFVFKEMEGDGEITAWVQDVEFTDPFSKGGVMIRSNLTPGSMNAMMYISGERRWSFQRRIENDNLTVSTKSEPGAVTFPHWVKLVRVGNEISGYHSKDGENWEYVDTDILPMESTIYMGLAVTSHNNSTVNTTILSQVNGEAGIPVNFPVELISFKANPEPDQQRIALSWATASETNNSHFTIEKSQDGSLFSPIMDVASLGNGTETQSYEAFDTAPFEGKSFYRLKQTDFDGTFTYSETVSATFEAKSAVELLTYPVPAKIGEYVNVELGLSESTSVGIKVKNMLGQTLWQHKSETLEQGKNTFKIDTSDLQAGMYYLEINYNQNRPEVLVQRMMLVD